MSDPLPMVFRLRGLAVEEVRRALADCLATETAAAEQLRELDATIAAETAAAGDSNGDDQSVEDFARWLRRTAVERAMAAATLVMAETRSTEARAVLAASRAAMSVIETLLEQRAEQAHQADARREQTILDEAGARREGR